MASFKLELQGIAELRNKYNAKTLDKSLIEAIGSVTFQLHNLLNSEIQARYYTNRSLNSILVSKINDRSFKFIGANLLEGNIEYKQEALNLAKFPSKSSFWGNLKEEKLRKGWVQKVAITRARGQVNIAGRYGYGGFRVGTPSNFGKWMLERKQKATWISKGVRAPTALVYGPSLADMARWTFNKNGNVVRFVNSFGDRVAKELKL